MAKRDFLVKAASTPPTPASQRRRRAAIWMLVVSVSAAVARVLSRVTVFTAGRNVEYELRAVLLSKLHKLGPLVLPPHAPRARS
jgi:ATP-binding cassette subfamily B protein